MSKFIVSARKYRPLRFEDVVGQQHVAQTLKNALATDHLAHAFLFCGPRGVGKTTCARILAKVLNCENRTDTFEACDACSSCKSFTENASFNIIELDAASNNSVEHIRALIEQVRFQPQQGQYKVFIIDEVHMLSNQAFNAFLKTLEEPPPYAIFILATTEKHKIIPTILSRCQIFDFRRISVGDMVLHLKNICEKEGIEVEDDALHIIAQKADGALRDSLSIFDRMVSFSGKKLLYNDVIENLNVLDYDYYFQITEGLLAEDIAAVMQLFDQILRKGFEPDIFLIGLAEHLRNILVCKDESTLNLLEVGDALRERYRKQASLAPASFLLTALSLANDCDINYKMARNKRLHVEMGLIKMAHIGQAVKGGLQAPVASTEKKTPDLNVATPAKQETSPAPSPEPSKNGNSANAQELDKEQLSSLSTELKLGLKKADKISLRLADFEEAVAVEQAEKAARESKFTLDATQAAWNAYTENVESPTLKLAMSSAILKIEEKNLIATVGLSIYQGLLNEENSRLLPYLRDTLHDDQIKLVVALDEEKPLKFKTRQRQTAP
ncbi:MAG: DNA polymerase III subunit gamma/tau [Saprospiraceae bacterium]